MDERVGNMDVINEIFEVNKQALDLAKQQIEVANKLKKDVEIMRTALEIIAADVGMMESPKEIAQAALEATQEPRKIKPDAEEE